jgi:hypothetical protein
VVRNPAKCLEKQCIEIAKDLATTVYKSSVWSIYSDYFCINLFLPPLQFWSCKRVAAMPLFKKKAAAGQIQQPQRC